MKGLNFPWFKRFGIFFIPVTIMGWIIFIAGIIYAVRLFLDIDSRSHSASDTLMNFAFNMIFVVIVYLAIAFLTSLKKN